MKSLKLLSVFLVGGTVLSGIAGPKSSLTPEQKAERHERMMRTTGGLLEVPGTGKFTVCVAQKRVSNEALKRFAEALGRQYRITMEVTELESFTLSDAAARAKKTGANVVVFAVDDSTLPMSLIASEGPWAVVNVAALATDKPISELLEERCKKMFTRAACTLLGAGFSPHKASIMQSVTSLAELDAIKTVNLDPQAMMSIFQRLQKLGVTPPKKVPYVKAVKEGWAPAPTNDIQKAIWEKVKNGAGAKK